MEEIYLYRLKEIQKNKEKLEKSLGISIEINGKKAILSGDPLAEYEATIIFQAINFGFSVYKALILKDPEYTFRIIPIKVHTRKKNLESVKGRVIGKNRKTMDAIENISSCYIKLKDNEVAVIGYADTIEEVSTAIKSLIKGTKQSNIYHFLEKVNAGRIPDNLGLKDTPQTNKV
jgi:KH domain-containing protein